MISLHSSETASVFYYNWVQPLRGFDLLDIHSFKEKIEEIHFASILPSYAYFLFY